MAWWSEALYQLYIILPNWTFFRTCSLCRYSVKHPKHSSDFGFPLSINIFTKGLYQWTYHHSKGCRECSAESQCLYAPGSVVPVSMSQPRGCHPQAMVGFWVLAHPCQLRPFPSREGHPQCHRVPAAPHLAVFNKPQRTHGDCLVSFVCTSKWPESGTDLDNHSIYTQYSLTT